MTTYSDVVDRVRYQLRAYTGQHEVSTYLSGALTNVATTATVANGAAIVDGIIEIGDELLWVDSVATNTLTLPPYGRGYQGSAAVAHSSGAQVLVDPLFPRKAIQDAIVDTQRALYPTLFAPKTVEFTYVAGQTTYGLPADMDRVLSISWQLSGDTGFWTPVRRWRADINANTTSFPNGNSLTLLDGVEPGRTVRVVYAAPFTELSLSTDTLALAGHQASHAELLLYGAAFRLVQFLEAGRLSMATVENPERAKYVQTGAASGLARQLLGLYEKRLDEERTRLLQLYPIQIRYTR